jgi:hypothetical protein
MRINRKLLSYRPSDLVNQLRANKFASNIVATIDSESLFEIRKTARERTVVLADLKYFDIEPWIAENIRRVLELGLRYKKKQTVLDIGTGFGYFPYVCEFFGQDAYALDVPGHGLYDDVTEFLKIKKTHHRIEPYETLPELPVQFDVITAFQIAFNRPNSEFMWKGPEWDFFLTDLSKKLKSGGSIHLELNCGVEFSEWYTGEVKTVFEKFGALTRGHQVKLSKLN